MAHGEPFHQIDEIRRWRRLELHAPAVGRMADYQAVCV
jgi:hypothetical protein